MSLVRYLLYFIACILSICLSHGSLADQLIIEPEMGRQPILTTLQSVRHSAKLVMYNLTDQTLISALCQQAEHGRDVQIILEAQPYKNIAGNQKTFQTLKQCQIKWHNHIPDINFIHQKTLVLDQHTAVVMTFNFTRASFKTERNFALIIDQPTEIKDIIATFAADWNHVAITQHHPNLIWSPENSRAKLLNFINSAKKRITDLCTKYC